MSKDDNIMNDFEENANELMKRKISKAKRSSK